jgi:homoserine O-acetyltransferase
VTFPEPLELEQGSRLPGVRVVYETYGRLSLRRDNAVLICHALSGDSHVARHDPDDTPGWWEIAVGPGKPIDTDRYFVICPNILGGCRGTTGPNSTNPETGRPYGPDFPVITVADMVDVQRLLVDHLGIGRLRAVVGGSLGGHMCLSWATRWADRVAGTIALATGPRLTSQAIAFDVVGRNAILRDPAYLEGEYYANGPGPTVGLSLARMLGHITYLSREAMIEKFDAQRLQPRQVQTQFETRFSVGSYLAYQGDKFVERFDANSYLALTMAIDLFDLGDTRQKLAESLRRSQCRWLLISFSTDWLFPAFQSQEMVDALIAEGKPVSYCNVASHCGHDAFLLADDLAVYGAMMRSFLANLGGETLADSPHPNPLPEGEGTRGPGEAASGQGRGTGSGHVAGGVATEDEAEDEASCHGPRSIFHRRRLDYDSIDSLIPPGASVLDLGCGTGGLLERLRRNGCRRLVGIELDERAILACIRRGLDVVHADLNQGLAAFTDRQFDFVVLSQTLQAVLDVQRVLAEMLRVGRQGIVSFPNFGFWKLRKQLSEEGRAPRSGPLLGYHWYDSPNVRFLSIADFEDYCLAQGITVHQRIALDTEADCEVRDDPNRNADVAIVVISK